MTIIQLLQQSRQLLVDHSREAWEIENCYDRNGLINDIMIISEEEWRERYDMFWQAMDINLGSSQYEVLENCSYDQILEVFDVAIKLAKLQVFA